MAKSTRVILGAAATLFAANALAAEITLFDRAEFQGERITITGDAPNFDRSGFNDRAASIIVRDGVWEVCTDAYFRGRCVQLQPGRYANLTGSLNDSISSVRPVGASPGYGGPPPRPGYGGPPPVAPPVAPSAGGGARAVLFEGVDFSGRAFPLDRETIRNLDRTGFNDRAQSLQVESGYWIFCSDANFEGDCRTFGPGEYPNLPGELSRRISSGRRIADRYPYGGPPSWDRR